MVYRSRGRRSDDSRALPQTRDLGSNFYNWQGKHRGMAMADSRLSKELEPESAKLKQMYADPPWGTHPFRTFRP